MWLCPILVAVKRVNDDLNENIYTNEAYKQYLTNDTRQDFVHQNTKVSHKNL